MSPEGIVEVCSLGDDEHVFFTGSVDLRVSNPGTLQAVTTQIVFESEEALDMIRALVEQKFGVAETQGLKVSLKMRPDPNGQVTENGEAYESGSYTVGVRPDMLKLK